MPTAVTNSRPSAHIHTESHRLCMCIVHFGRSTHTLATESYGHHQYKCDSDTAQQNIPKHTEQYSFFHSVAFNINTHTHVHIQYGKYNMHTTERLAYVPKWGTQTECVFYRLVRATPFIRLGFQSLSPSPAGFD